MTEILTTSNSLETGEKTGKRQGFMRAPRETTGQPATTSCEDDLATPAPQPLLRMQDLEVAYGSNTVLHDVNLEIQSGQFAGLLGSNGAGKTTLIRTILGLIRPRTGVIEVDGARSAATRQVKVGYVPQHRAYAWGYPIDVAGTVLIDEVRQLGWGRHAKATDRGDVYATLGLAGMTALTRRSLEQLSGGQRQRVLVARTLVNHPQLLILDEPFTDSDQPAVESLSVLFSELTGGGQTLLMSMHDLMGALEVCGRLVLLRGTVQTTGAPGELLIPKPWQYTFGVGSGSLLVRLIAAFTTTTHSGGA